MSPVHLDLTLGREDDRPHRMDPVAFRVALLGDWSGRASRGVSTPASAIVERPPRRVDRDGLDQVLLELRPAVTLRLSPDAPPVTIEFERLEDFHPDQLFQRLPLLQGLRAAREGPGPPPPAPGKLLADIIDAASPPAATEAVARSAGDLQAFLDRLVRPYLVPRSDPASGERIAQVEAAAGGLLRAILHAPAFQALEALWRCADLLVHRIDTGPELHLDLIDLAEEELESVLPSGGDPTTSPLQHMLARLAADESWSLLVAGYSFGIGAVEVDRLAQLACIGALQGAPWIAAADPALVGWEPAEGWEGLSRSPPPASPHWEALRASGLARWIGLVLPRFLLRLPYGKDGDDCETLRFEELGHPAQHEAFLWGNPAFAVALVVARAFAEAGWRLREAINPEIGGLPFVLIAEGGAKEAVPTAEFLMTVTLADRIMDRGVMPLATLEDQDRVRLLRLQSVAEPPAPLAGRWSDR